MTVAATSSGDRRIDLTDSFVTVMQNARGVADPARGPSGHGPSAHVLGSHAAGLLTRDRRHVRGSVRRPVARLRSGAHRLRLHVHGSRPARRCALMTFVVKGLSEVYDPRGGFPIPIRDGIVAPKNADAVPGGTPGSRPRDREIAKVTETARRLVADARSSRPHAAAARADRQLADCRLAARRAVHRGGENRAANAGRAHARRDDVGRHRPRIPGAAVASTIATARRSRSMLALNPRAIAEARALDAERAAGRVRGPLHGIPVAFKDNIDVLGLPTTGGSLALVDHRPRLDSRVAAGMRRAGAVVLGKTNLDEFPFGDFGISSVGGTIGNAYDPSLSTAGSSGGSAVAVSSSLVTLGFGTDTCNSLSNPASFASLATIRTTRGLTSRAGVMPLNTYNDAVGPIAKSVRELALVLDAVTGSDAEDEATADADRHIKGSFPPGLDTGALKGARIGVMRQLFVGVTGEREAAASMERVIAELKAAGADDRGCRGFRTSTSGTRRREAAHRVRSRQAGRRTSHEAPGRETRWSRSTTC